MGGTSSNHFGGGYAACDSSNEFSRLTQLVSKNVPMMTQNVTKMQRMVIQIGTHQDSPQLRDQLHQIQHYTNQLAKDTGRYIRELSHLPQPSNQSEQGQRKTQREMLVNDFTTSLNNLQAVQRQAAETEKASVARARASSGLSSSPFLDERRGDDMLVGESPQAIQMEENLDLDLIREREQAIRQLESAIMDVNQLFNNLGMLVHEQGHKIDNIEANVETTAVQVESGRDQLAKAQTYQRKSGRKMCICIFVIAIVITGIVIGIIVGVTLQ